MMLCICNSFVDAWTSGSSNGSGRRQFIDRAIDAGATTLICGTVIATSPAAANAAAGDTKIYRPAPHSLDGKVAVITGANTGLGLESSKRLAAAGATVIMTSRSLEKGERAVQEVNEYLTNNSVAKSDNQRIVVLPLDLCDFDSVRAFPKLLSQKLSGKSVDVLMNNAGVMAVPDRRLSKDGFEKTFQTNHLGHFLLTSELMSQLSKDARVVTVSSLGYQFASKGLEIDNLNGESKYGPWSAYGLSKLENILFTKELQARADSAGLSLTAVALHPGAVQTDLARYLVGEEKMEKMKREGFTNWKDKVLFEGLAKFVLTVEEGASTQVYLAAGEGGKNIGGKVFSDCKELALGSAAMDMEKAKELWSISEKLTGSKFNI